MEKQFKILFTDEHQFLVLFVIFPKRVAVAILDFQTSWEHYTLHCQAHVAAPDRLYLNGVLFLP